MMSSILSFLIVTSLAFADPAYPGGDVVDSGSDPVATEVVRERWAGLVAFMGHRKIPIFGRIKYRTDTYVMADVEREGDVIRLVQRSCRIKFKKIWGIKAAISPEAITKMNPIHITFTRDEDMMRAPEWPSGWDEEDLDGDGNPGVTIEVKSLFCSGDLYVTSSAVSSAEGPVSEAGLIGDTRVSVTQRHLGASNRCLNFGASDSADLMTGRFNYVPVAQNATCADLLEQGWPADLNMED